MPRVISANCGRGKNLICLKSIVLIFSPALLHFITQKFAEKPLHHCGGCSISKMNISNLTKGCIMRELCNCNTCIYHDVDVCGHHVCFASIDWLSPDINSDGSQCSSYISISDGFQYQLQLE